MNVFGHKMENRNENFFWKLTGTCPPLPPPPMLICLVRMAQIEVERPAKPPNTCTNKQFKRNISIPSISYKQNTWQKRLHRIAQNAHAIKHDTHDWTWYTWVNMIEQLTFWVHGQIFTPKGPPGQTIQHLKQESLKTDQSDKPSNHQQENWYNEGQDWTWRTEQTGCTGYRMAGGTDEQVEWCTGWTG